MLPSQLRRPCRQRSTFATCRRIFRLVCVLRLLDKPASYLPKMVAQGRSFPAKRSRPHMFERLTSPAAVDAARQQITALFNQHAEWFCTTDIGGAAGRGETYALRRNEMDVSVAHGR